MGSRSRYCYASIRSADEQTVRDREQRHRRVQSIGPNVENDLGPAQCRCICRLTINTFVWNSFCAFSEQHCLLGSFKTHSFSIVSFVVAHSPRKTGISPKKQACPSYHAFGRRHPQFRAFNWWKIGILFCQNVWSLDWFRWRFESLYKFMNKYRRTSAITHYNVNCWMIILINALAKLLMPLVYYTSSEFLSAHLPAPLEPIMPERN